MAVAERTDTISVLIVEDDPLSISAMEVALSGRGIVCYSTHSPMKALNMASERDIDVIISDLNMPGMNGILFHRAVYEKFGNKPFIMVTGTSHYAEKELESLVRSGIILIRKPFSPDGLVDEVLRLAGKRD